MDIEITIKETHTTEQAVETTANDADLSAEFGRLTMNHIKAQGELKSFLKAHYEFVSAFKYDNLLN